MTHPHQPETFKHHEGAAGAPALCGAVADAYSRDNSYAHVFPNRACSDRNKTDEQLSAELHFGAVQTPDHAKGLQDIHRGLDGVNSASSHLHDAMYSARHGDINGALQGLRSTSGDLYSGGGKVDRGAGNVGDLLKGDPTAQRSLNKAFEEESSTGSHIEQAAGRLRRGDINGALRSMGRGADELSEEQKALHHGLAQLTRDDATTDHAQGLKDIRASITGGDAATVDLSHAIHSARHGDYNGAIQHLRNSSSDLNSAGARLDSGAANVGDLLHTDRNARNSINRGFDKEQDASYHINKAERLLRDGDVDGALDSMYKALPELARNKRLCVTD
jgi:hypothetical protein